MLYFVYEFSEVMMVLFRIIFYVLGIVFMGNSSLFAEEVALKFRGQNPNGATALIIDNRNPIAGQIDEILKNFTANDFKVALVPSDYTYDLNTLTKDNSPFVKEVKYVIRINVLTKAMTEQSIKAFVEVLRLEDGKMVAKEIAGPKNAINLFTVQIREMLLNLMPQVSYTNPNITAVDGALFTFPTKDFYALRRGDEVLIRYAEARGGLTESVAVVQKFSNETAVLKDINKKVALNDTVLRATPKRNRFSFSLGVNVPTAGESTLIAKKDTFQWQSSTRWPAGFKIEGEYERFIPYQLVSTTTFGISVDGILNTYLMTGIGYRILQYSWEFMPYLRLGIMYTPLSLNNIAGGGSSLQGLSLKFGLNIGISIIKRVTQSIFIGVDVGVQYFPLEYVSVLHDSDTIKPQWKHGDEFRDDFSMTELYPYLSIKVGWLF